MQSPPKTQREESESEFQKVAECLYRRTSSGVYYGLVKRAGKQYRRSLKTTDRKLAERNLSDFRQKVGRLDHKKNSGSVTFAEIAKRWLATIKPQLKASSARRRETSVQQIQTHIGATPARKLTSATFENWASTRGAGISASTYNNERDTIIAVMNFAKREGLLLDNSALVLRRRKLGKSEVVIPSQEEFRSLVNGLRALDKRAQEAANLVELLAYSGMRLAEATAIRWTDINFEESRFVVTGGELGTKNHDVRVVPLFPALRGFLEPLHAARHPAASDRIVSIDSAKTAMGHACRLANITRFNHHSLRHYFVSNAVEAGIDFKTIAAWVGHKDGGLLVARTYGHLRDVHSTEMAKRMTFSAQ
jgi:integrase